jgi:hypothetical protein
MWEEVVVAEYEDLPGALRKTTKHSNRIACFRAVRFGAGNYELDWLPALPSYSIYEYLQQALDTVRVT